MNSPDSYYFSLFFFFFSVSFITSIEYVDLPSSFIQKNFHEVIVAQPITIEQKTEKKQINDRLERTLSKSSIDNSPIFMIYTRDDDVNDVNDKTKVRKSLWHLPATNSGLRIFWYCYTWPLKFLLTMTIPNPKTYRRLYPLTFLMCIIWIGSNAYLVVWMVTVIGKMSRLDLYVVCVCLCFTTLKL